MHCPRCQHENRDGARFCEECGTPFAVSCAACGTELRAGSKFCDNCGQPVLGGPASRGSEPRVSTADPAARQHIFDGHSASSSLLDHERKQVTVLFADINGSTELVADRDPDDARRLLDPILERMQEAVQLYEGTVTRVMGDGIMALFGAPVAYEDHALRACYSALKMQESIGKYAELVRRTEGFPLQIRVGLNSGEVAARGLPGESPMHYSFNGHPVHLAARMEQLAIPGTILMASETFHLTQGYLETKALGSMAVKGLTAPVETYELLGANALRSRLQVAAARGLTRFVGRLDEISQLRHARDRVRTVGRGELFAIVGEPGVGKSRLVHEFAHSEPADDCRIFEVGTASYGTGTSYLPVTEFLRGYFQITASDDLLAVREKVTGKLLSIDESLLPVLPALLALLDLPQDEPRHPSFASPQRRQSTLEAIKRLLFRESEVQPLVMILEDMQTVDPDTQALMDGLVDSLPAARILLVLTYRPEYRHGWSGKPYYNQIRMEPLAAVGAWELLEALAGTDSGLEPLKRLLIEKTAGNPFFLEESVRALAESGALTGKPGAYAVTKPVADLTVPATIGALLASRIDRLSQIDKRLLQCAAVIGYRVPLGVLQAVGELSPEILRQALERLQAAEFLRETSLFPDPEYTFRHALIHEVAYRGLSLDRRRALHTSALTAGEELYPEQALEKADWLAFHAFRGQVWDRAVRYLRSAAARAIRRAASRIAVQHLENALIAAEHLPDADRAPLEVDLRFDLRHALTPLGQTQRALEHLQAAEPFAARIGDRSRLGRIVSFTANCLLIQSKYAEALTTGARALTIARELENRSLEVATRIYMARARLSRGECGKAVELLQETIRALNENPPDDFLGLPVLPAAYARSILAASLAETGDFTEAATHASEAARRATSSGQPDSIMWADWSRGLVAIRRGETGDAVLIFERLRDLCRAHDLDAYRSRVMAGLGCARARSGLIKEGLQLLETAVAIDASAEPKVTRSFALNALAEGLFLGGDDERALVVAKQALQFTREHEERGAEAYARFVLGVIHGTRVGEIDAAYEALRASETIAAELGLRPLLAHCHLGLGDLHRKQGEASAAGSHRQRGASLLEALEMKQWFGFDRAAGSGARSGAAL